MNSAVAIPLSFVGGDVHEYRAGSRKLHSVTTILRDVGFYPEYRGVDKKYRQLGSAVHHACQMYDMGIEPAAPYHPDVQARLNHYMRFKADTGFQGHCWEVALADPDRNHAGTLDIIGTFDKKPPYRLTIVDIKTGTVPMLGVATQLAAYMDLVRNGRIIPIERHPLMPLDVETFKVFAEKGTFQRKSLQLTADDYTLRSHDEPRWSAMWRAGLTVFNTWQEHGKQ